MNKLVKFTTTRKIHFFALAAWIGTAVVYFNLDESVDWAFAWGAVLGGICIGLMALQAQDIDRREGRYFDEPPFEDKE